MVPATEFSHRLATMADLPEMRALRMLAIRQLLPAYLDPARVEASFEISVFYHFLDMKTGRRVWECELSTIDSAFLFAGMVTYSAYFDADTENKSWAAGGGRADRRRTGSAVRR